MPVRFIIGRAGSGKTHHCVQGIVRALIENPLGPPLIWLLPEQATFGAERLLITHPHIRGMFRATITGFRRLVHSVAADLGIGGGTHIDDLGRIILLENLVQQNRDRLVLFGRVADRPGFITNLDRILREFQQHGHTPDSLRELAARFSANRTDQILADKLHDLAALLAAWQAALVDRHLDPDLLEQTVAERLGQSALVSGARIWVDAFSAMNLLEIRMLTALAQTAASLEITLLADPDAAAIQDRNVPPDPLSPFFRTQRLYRQLMRTFEANRIAVDAPILFRGPPHRVANAAGLRRIERDLFLPEPPTADDPNPPSDVQLLQCANPEAEVRVAAQRIRQWITSDPMLRYRDIGLIIPHLEGYQDIVRRIFTQHNIPHFIDIRRPIAHHPLVELLRTAVALPLNGFARDDLVLLLKTGLTNIGEEDADELENYLLGHGVSHHDLAAPFLFAEPNEFEDADDAPLSTAQRAYLDRVNRIRQTLHAALAPWFEAAAAGPTGDILTRALFALLERFDVKGKIDALMRQARHAGRHEAVLIHQQAWKQVIHLLDTLDGTLRLTPAPLLAFARILSVALESLTLGLIPPTIDQVLVSSVARSRHPELRIAMILGALETHFPRVESEDPLLGDRQRSLFNAAAQDEPIGTGAADRMIESNFLDYVAFTRAHERLIVSYPAADQEGRAVVPSQYVQRLGALFPGLQTQSIGPAQEYALDHLATRNDLLSAVLQWGRRRITPQYRQGPASAGEPTVQDEPRMPAAYNWLISAAGHGAAGVKLAQAWASLLPVVAPRIDPALAARFHGTVMAMSVSQLEKFASCPLQYFMHYTLGLRPRFILELDVLDVGILYHRILERVFDGVIAGSLPWPNCDSAALRSVLQREAQAAAAELHAELTQNSPEYPKVLLRVRNNLQTVLERQRRAALAGDLRPAATELVFGRANDSVPTTSARKFSLPVLAVPTPHDRTVELNGKIDRVDLSGGKPGTESIRGVVLDYKSGNGRDLPLAKIYYGLALQLPIYMLVLRECGAAITGSAVDPIAAFFVPLSPSRKTEPDLTQITDPASDAFFQETPPRGLIDASQIQHLDAAISEDTLHSDWYKYKRTKKGDLSKTGNDAVEHTDFSAILAFTAHKIAEMADALAAGHIAPKPYRAKSEIPCTRCDFISVCPFDRIHGDFRNLRSLKRDEALEMMRHELAAQQK